MSLKTVMLVGSGAVAGAWPPVIKAMCKVDRREVISPHGANFQMARLVHLARLKLEPAHEEILDLLRRAKSEIARELKEAEERGELSVREEFYQVAERFLGEDDQVALITTNWDHTIENALERVYDNVDVYHLHGGINDCEALYLPTEIVEEHYRRENHTTFLANLRNGLVRIVTMADRIVFYGLSLSPLDVELGAALAAGLDGSTVKEIHVVDPDYPHIAERIATLGKAGTPDLPVHCYHPQMLANSWLYQASDVSSEVAKLARRMSA